MDHGLERKETDGKGGRRAGQGRSLYCRSGIGTARGEAPGYVQVCPLPAGNLLNHLTPPDRALRASHSRRERAQRMTSSSLIKHLEDVPLMYCVLELEVVHAEPLEHAVISQGGLTSVQLFRSCSRREASTSSLSACCTSVNTHIAGELKCQADPLFNSI